MKALVLCPTCEKRGIKNVLGEVEPDGSFAVLRFHAGLTKIRGQQFEVQCGQCGEIVFFRKLLEERRANAGTILNHWITRLSWGTSSFQAGTARAGSIAR